MKKVLLIWLSVRAKGKLAVDASHGFPSCFQKWFRRVSSTVPSCVLCGICAAAEVAKVQSKRSKNVEQLQISGELSRLFSADSNQQYGPRVDVRRFGVQEEENKDAYETVINAAKKAGSHVSRAPRTSARGSGGYQHLSQSLQPEGEAWPRAYKVCAYACTNWPDDI